MFFSVPVKVSAGRWSATVEYQGGQGAKEDDASWCVVKNKVYYCIVVSTRAGVVSGSNRKPVLSSNRKPVSTAIRSHLHVSDTLRTPST